MEKEDLLQQVYDALANGKDLRKIKVKFQDGQVIKFDFDGNQVEIEEVNEDEVEEEDEEEEDVEEEDDEEEEDEEEDDEDDEDDEDQDQPEDALENNGTSNKTSHQTNQASGRRVNVINRS